MAVGNKMANSFVLAVACRLSAFFPSREFNRGISASYRSNSRSLLKIRGISGAQSMRWRLFWGCPWPIALVTIWRRRAAP